MTTATGDPAAAEASMKPPRLGLRRLLSTPGYARLLITRFLAHWGDGVFQAGIGGAVLFNPEREADPLAIAAGFAVILLPYSLVGPFAGALLDRWDRRQVLLVANLVRGALILLVAVAVGTGVAGLPLYASALLVMGVSRFVGAGLSASLPHTMDEEHLVEANAILATGGAAMAAVGGGCAFALRAIFGGDDFGSAWVTACAVVGSVLAALAASGFAKGSLGPDERDEPAKAVTAIAHGLIDSGKVAARTRSVATGFSALIAHRIGFGTSMLLGLLLMRFAFTDVGWLKAGIAGVGEALAAGAIGLVLAAFITAPAVHRFGRKATVCGALFVSAAAQLGLGLPMTLPSILGAVLVVACCSQVIKLCVDSAVQHDVGDEARGRVFALYDALFNLTFVSAITVTALLVAPDGRSPELMSAGACAYLIGLGAYLVIDRRMARRAA
ncbi:MFS transporter [Allokutzneria sp. A3M-2-11 16]|uniref:MFS transporter n=1 Tax=Allokutzneria sp. A3M-2-11 16 TaxID=2962043 RepID=UPI0027E2BB20|nr:MFS transporter [Allokutzneria sp. A3M-2-11 16]